MRKLEETEIEQPLSLIFNKDNRDSSGNYICIVQDNDGNRLGYATFAEGTVIGEAKPSKTSLLERQTEATERLADALYILVQRDEARVYSISDNELKAMHYSYRKPELDTNKPH